MEKPPVRVRVWDLPTRLFPWLLATLVAFSFTSAKIGGAWTEWHFRSGYTILALLLFPACYGAALATATRVFRASYADRAPSLPTWPDAARPVTATARSVAGR